MFSQVDSVLMLMKQVSISHAVMCFEIKSCWNAVYHQMWVSIDKIAQPARIYAFTNLKLIQMLHSGGGGKSLENSHPKMPLCGTNTSNYHAKTCDSATAKQPARTVAACFN